MRDKHIILDYEKSIEIIKTLEKENQELKKNLEKKYEKVGTLTAELLYEENTNLINEITVLKIENQKLNEQLEIKHNGFMASVEEACELAKENQKYKEVIDKVNKLIAENSEKYWIDDEGEPKYLFNEIRDILSEVTNAK